MKVASELGIQIPNQLKVIGYDGTQSVRRLLPQLTTIKQPIEEIAQSAVLRLMDIINEVNKDERMEVILPVQLLKSETA